MSNKFVLNRKTVGDILKSEGIRDAMLVKAQQISGNAGDGYRAIVMPTRAIVVPDTKKAAQDNLDNNTLLKAVQR